VALAKLADATSKVKIEIERIESSGQNLVKRTGDRFRLTMQVITKAKLVSTLYSS